MGLLGGDGWLTPHASRGESGRGRRSSLPAAPALGLSGGSGSCDFGTVITRPATDRGEELRGEAMYAMTTTTITHAERGESEGIMRIDKRRLASLVVLVCVVACVFGVGAASAVASNSTLEFGGPGEGAGQLSDPHGVAVDQLTGDVYVADKENERVDEFESNGTFVRAWGWGVDREHSEAKLQECTLTTGCVKGEGGGGSGEFGEPDGIAVYSELGHEAVYVLELGNKRVQEFTPEGQFVRMWGSEGTGDGEFDELGLQGAIAVGPGGSVYVGDYRRVQRFNSEGKLETSFPVVAENQVEALAVTSGGEVCLTVNEHSNYTQEAPPTEVRCYSSAGKLEHTLQLEKHVYSPTGETIINLAADGSGDLYVDEYLSEDNVNVTPRVAFATQKILEFKEGGEQVKRFGIPGGEGGPVRVVDAEAVEEASARRRPSGLGLSESGGVATGVLLGFRAEEESVVRGESAPPPGPTVENEVGVPGEPASTATLRASLDPQGKATKYYFEYGPEGGSVTTSGTFTLAGSEFSPEAVEFKVEGLLPGTAYRFRVVAVNGEGTVPGEEVGFTTLPAARIDTVSVGEVTGNSAELQARIDPLQSDTKYRLEYMPVGGGEFKLAGEGDAGSGSADVAVNAHVQELASDTEYAYRVVAVNALGEAASGARFVTQRAGGGFTLLDGRAWEQVSPEQKGVANITFLAGGAGPHRSSPGGEALTFNVVGYPEDDPEGELVTEPAQVIARHGPGGWSSHDIATPNRERPHKGAKIGETGEYWLFSEGLERSVLEPSPATPLSRWTTERTPYLRDEAECPVPPASEGALLASECFTPLVTSAGPFADVAKGIEFGGPIDVQTGEVVVVEATPDLAHMLLLANGVELLPGMGGSGLYEWSNGRLTPLSLPPEKMAPCNHVGLGVAGGPSDLGLDSRNALSPDGQITVWSTSLSTGACSGHVFLRDLADGKEESIQLDRVQPGVEEPGAPEALYQDASVGDEHVFFTDSQRLTAGSTSTQAGFANASRTAADLYEYDLDRATGTGGLVDMTVPVKAGEAAGVLGVEGASEDGSQVYVVATGVLSERANAHKEVATPGADNLYLLERSGSSWRAVFIATLSGLDGPDWNPGIGSTAGWQTARVSPDGKWLAFMSQQSLTGYDNEDVTSKKPGERMDEEVFLYDAVSNRLICASCDPTGARPAGVLNVESGAGREVPLMDRVGKELWEGRWLAGAVPVTYSIGINGKLGVRQPRYLSNGGRLFFDASDGLLPVDKNDQVDAYEYEPPRNGEIAQSDDCTAGSATYSPAAEGCVDLVSSGESSEESVFVEASENGNDVFFLTSASLVPGDRDSAYDVYDAHVCGSGWECQGQAAVSPSCTGTESCRGVSAPQPSIFGASGTATFSGPGNSASAAAPAAGPPPKKVTKKTVKCKEGFVRKKVKTKQVCVKKPKKAKKAKKASRASRRAK